MSELAIRAAMNDHLVLGDLLTPRPGPRLASRPVASQLVADAHVASARPVLAELARDAGIPYVVDPDTVLLQSDVAVGDRWVQLPYGVADALVPAQIRVGELVESACRVPARPGCHRHRPALLLRHHAARSCSATSRCARR
jgi:hypothetical protein